MGLTEMEWQGGVWQRWLERLSRAAVERDDSRVRVALPVVRISRSEDISNH